MIRIAIDLELHNDGPSQGNPNPPCGEIIQVGWAIFSTERGILEVGGDYIKTGKPLSPYIQKLTGIKERDIEERGVSIHEAYLNMQARWNYWVAEGKEIGEGHFSQLIEFGHQDANEFKQELIDKQFEPLSNYLCTDKNLLPHHSFDTSIDCDGNSVVNHIKNNYTWTFGRATLNLKAVYQMVRMAQGKPYRGGLSKALSSLGLNFQSYKQEIKPGVFKQFGKHNAMADSLNTALMYLELQKYIKNDISN